MKGTDVIGTLQINLAFAIFGTPKGVHCNMCIFFSETDVYQDKTVRI